jgi:hypothetical protein
LATMRDETAEGLPEGTEYLRSNRDEAS